MSSEVRHNFIRGLIALARPRDWWLSKIPFAIAAALLLVPGVPILRLMLVIGAIVSWAAFGFGINEIHDRISDARAGKSNRATGIPSHMLNSFLLVTATLTLLFAVLAAADVMTPVFVVIGLGLTITYSARPIRFKERGLLGLAIAALAQWTLPVLAIASVQPGGWMQPAAAGFALLGLAIGVRWMAVHQHADALTDRVAGVRTYAALGGRIFGLIYLAFAAELFFLACLFALTWPQSTGAVLAFAVWLVIDCILYNPLKQFFSRLLGYVNAPLSSYYFLALPGVLVLDQLMPALTWLWAPIVAIAIHAVNVILVRRYMAGKITPTATILEAMERSPEKAVDAGLAFIAKHQKPDGGFDVLLAYNPDFTNAVAIRCVFETALMARLLPNWQEDVRASYALARAQEFLKTERDVSGLWRYFGRDSLIPADADDISCSIIALPVDERDASVIEVVLSNAEPEGPVFTWLLDPASGPPHRNGIDATVNANVYTMLTIRGMDAPGIRRYLEAAIADRSYISNVPYYPTAFFFLYLMARLAGSFGEGFLNKIKLETIWLLETTQSPSIIDIAMAYSTLVGTGADEKLCRPLLQQILREQRTDGGWRAAALAWGLNRGRFWNGSRELTTAYCLEAISISIRLPVAVSNTQSSLSTT